MAHEELLKKLQTAKLPSYYGNAKILWIGLGDDPDDDEMPILAIIGYNDKPEAQPYWFTSEGYFNVGNDNPERNLMFPDEQLEPVSETLQTEPETTPIDWTKATHTVDDLELETIVFDPKTETYFGKLASSVCTLNWNLAGCAVNQGTYRGYDLVPPKSEYETLKQKFMSATHTKGGHEVIEVMFPSEQTWNLFPADSEECISVFVMMPKKSSKRVSYYKDGRYYLTEPSDYDII